MHATVLVLCVCTGVRRVPGVGLGHGKEPLAALFQVWCTARHLAHTALRLVVCGLRLTS